MNKLIGYQKQRKGKKSTSNLLTQSFKQLNSISEKNSNWTDITENKTCIMHTNQLKLWTNKNLQNTAIFTWESHALLEMPKQFFKPLLGGYQKQEQTQHCFKPVLFITYHFIRLPFLSTLAMLEVSTFKTLVQTRNYLR